MRNEANSGEIEILYLPPRNASKLKCISAKRSKNQSFNRNQYTQVGAFQLPCASFRIDFSFTMGRKEEAKQHNIF
jgi:hypothetical protein